MKNIIITIMILMFTMSLVSATYYCPEPIELHSGWNSFSLYPNSTQVSQTGDRNISIVVGYNLIGYSSRNSIKLTDTYFTNDAGTIYTYTQAHNLGIINVSYTENTLSTTMIGQPIYFYSTEAYWVKSSQSGNLTFPSAGGSTSGQTYNWNKLRFSNGTSEMNVTDADAADWIFTSSGNSRYFEYWDPDNRVWRTICGNDFDCTKTTISSWEGIFVYSNVNNLTLILENSTCPYTLTFKYKSNTFRVDESDTLHLSMKGNEFIVSMDNKLTLRTFLSHLSRWVGRYI